MPISLKRSHWMNVIALVVVTLVLFGLYLHVELRITGGEFGVPLDDTWIHYQFARNLSHGDGFSFNPGEPTPGSTAPLWTLMLAVVALFAKDLLLPSLALSAAFHLLTVILTYRFAYALTESRRSATLAAVSTVLTGRLLWAGLAGMETTLFAAFSVAAVWTYTRHGLVPLTAVLLGLSGQVRPEAHALFALVVLDTVWPWRRQAKGGRAEMAAMFRSIGGSLMIYGAIAAPYLIFSLTTTGRPLANTFYAKVSSQHVFSWRTLQETFRLHWNDNPVSLLLVLVGVLPTWRRGGRLVVGWLFILPILTAVLVDFVWHHGRYTMPLVPFQMIVATTGIHHLLEKMRVGERRPTASYPILRYGVTTLLTMLLILGGLRQVPRWADMLGRNVKEILEVDVALGKWLAVNTPPDALVAVDDIGAITYLSRRRVVDMNGLITPEMWPAVRSAPGLSRSQTATRILSDLGPDYMVAFPSWHWEIATAPAVSEPIHSVRTETRTIIGEQEAVVYRMSWPYIGVASPMVRKVVTLGSSIQLLGYDIAHQAGGDPLVLVLYWRSLSPVEEDYDVFIHVVDDKGHIVAQVDQKPVNALASTHMWRSGDIIRDAYELNLPGDLTAGSYEIMAGMYLRESGERLVVNDADAINNAIRLTKIEWAP